MNGKKTHSEFLKELQEKQLDLFNKIEFLSEYTSNYSYILVKNKYGICKNKPFNLLRRQTPAIQSSINKNEYFINQAIEIHGNMYDYSLVNYIDSFTKVKIISKHGMFEQSPNSHLSGRGCPKKELI